MTRDSGLASEIRRCRLCAERFAATRTAHAPRPVAWFRAGVRMLVASQAPGMRVHHSGKPFDDPSGDRLRDWLGMAPEAFYDRSRVAIVPMAFCFPGYGPTGGDLPPPPVCARTWQDRVMAEIGADAIPLCVIAGGHAHARHLGGRLSVTERVRRWRDWAPRRFAVPHPSWRNSGWLKANPWFEAELVPALRARVREVMEG